MINKGVFPILGINIHAVDYEYAVTKILSAATDGEAYSVSALAVHGVMTGVLDQEHAVRLNSLDLIVPDGQPVRWALSWLHGIKLRKRVYGPELTLRAVEALAKAGLGIFLYGSTEKVLWLLESALRERYPDLIIAGTQASCFTQVSPEQQAKIAQQILASGAKAVLVGLGCPRQEVWVYENKKLLSMPTLAVGAAFDFHSGLLPQAPAWMQRRGLEWLYRLFCEPTRLWRRYLYLNPLYLWNIFCEKLGFISYSTTQSDSEVSYRGYA